MARLEELKSDFTPLVYFQMLGLHICEVCSVVSLSYVHILNAS